MKKSLEKSSSILILILIFSVFLNSYFEYIQSKKIEAQIKSGRIQYFNEIGWVDWAHARTAGAKKLIKQLRQNNKEITYYQQMQKSILGKTFSVRLTNSYLTPVNYTEEDQNSVAYYIFNEVNNDFEKMQDSFPFKYGEDLGDINGNNIAFILAQSDSDFLPFIYVPVSVKEALKLYSEGKDINRISPILEQKIEEKIPIKKNDSMVEYNLTFTE